MAKIFSKKRRRAVFVAVGLMGLVILAILLYVARLDLNAWKAEIEARASKATRTQVTIQGNLERKRWFPLTVVVQGLQFQRRDEPFLRLDRVECAGLELGSLLRGRLRMKTCTVNGFVIAIVKGADGQFNFRRAGERPKPPAGAGSAPVLLASRVIARGGAYTFADRTDSSGAEITGISADLNDFAIGHSPMRRAFSFKGAISCDTLQRDTLTATNLKSPVSAGGGHFLLDDLSLDIFDAQGAGNFAADTTERTPRFELNLDVPRCRVERLLEGLHAERLIGGEAALAIHVRAAGRNREQLTQTLSGDGSLIGTDLQTYDLDVDKLIKKFDKTRGFNLVDFAAFFVAGPLGTIATKGYDYGRVYKQLGTGQGKLDRLVATWEIEDGVAQAKDCALATKKNRVAFAGKIDLARRVYQGAAVAVLDEHGCSRYTEKLAGPVGDGKQTAKTTMKKLAGPFVGLFQKLRRAVEQDEKCDVFYGGSVPHPPEEGGRGSNRADTASRRTPKVRIAAPNSPYDPSSSARSVTTGE